MTMIGILQIVSFFVILIAITKPLWAFMSRIFQGERTFLHPILRPIERLVYWASGVREDDEQSWVRYTASLLSLSLFSFVIVYLLQRLQGLLPLNPQHFSTANAPGNATAMTPDLAFNTAVSFMTNTNWQSYVPETTMSYLVQMTALAVQTFISAAVGIAVAVALVRGFARHSAKAIGNLWVDVTRSVVYVLLPISLLAALFFCWQGSIQNYKPYEVVQTMEGVPQTIGQGPLASQLAIKMLGTNGGGFFNANSAHPFENPTPLSNYLQMLSIFAIPAGLTYTLGRMTKSSQHGWAVWAAMAVLFLCGVTTAYWAEAKGNPLLKGVDQHASTRQSGGNMEGKEVRFGIAGSALFATVTTDASCGAINSWHDSFTPLGGLVPLANIMLSETVFGGVGAGMYGILIYVVLAVFIAGLMVGRTPEYLGKKIEAYDVKMAMLVTLVFPFVILTLSGISSVEGFGTSSINNPGPHGLTHILYSFTSQAGNNGSAFAGLNGNTPWYNVSGGFTMLIGRFFMIIPMLAIAGNLAQKKTVPASAGTFPVTTPLFVVLLVSVIVIVGALTFFPALSLGPILEHLLMQAGRVF